MKGFKSFANRTEILLGDRYNCILGPNGSGKSNVLDAVCFVLGKSGARSLRAEKTANLVYNGGKKNKPAKEGEVSIFFDNTKGTFPTEDRQVKVTRIVKNDGQSIYKINDKRRTRGEILELLSVARIDPNGYNIILQGDIVRFVEMHPAQRRTIVEEIAGISVYEEKKNAALRELDRVQQKLSDSEIILTERNSYLQELRKERDQALKYQEMADKIKQNKASYLKIQIDRKGKAKDEQQKKVDALNEKVEKHNSKVSELKQKNRELREEIENISKEVEQRGEVEQVQLNKEIESLKVDIATNKTRLDTLNQEIGRIGTRREGIKENMKESEGELNSTKANMAEKEKLLSDTRKEKDIIEKKIEEFRKKNNLDDAGDIETQIDQLDRDAEEKQKQIQVLREDQQNMIREQDRISYQIQTLDERIAKVLEIEKEHKDQIEGLKTMKQRFKAVTMELNRSLDEDSTISAKLGDSRKRLIDTNERLAKLKARNASVQDRLSEDMAIRKINENKGRFNGVLGTVSELGNVSSKYATALETAAGPRLKSIVVENDKVAAECIRYLKTNRLGTATFLPLNKIKGREPDPKIEALASSRGVEGLAIDLVEFEPRLKRIFNYIFANTLVIKDIEVARRIGVGKAKMVTLDGDSAEMSGAMHGGYRKAKKSGYGFKEKELTKDIETTEGRIAELQGVISIMEKKRNDNEEKIQRLREEKASLEGEIIKQEKSLHLESGDMDATKNEKKRLDTELEQVTKKIDHITDTISKENRALADCKIRKQSLRSKVNELRNPVKLAELNTFEEKRGELSEKAIRLESDIRSMETQIEKMFGKERKSSEKILQDLDVEEESYGKEMKKLADTISKDDKELKVKEQKAAKFYSQFKALFAKRTKIQGDIQKNDIDIDKNMEQSRELEKKSNLIGLQLAQIGAELSSLENEFEQYHGIELFTNKSEESLKNEIRKFEKMVADIGSVNMKALEIYDNVEKEYNRLQEKKEKLMLEKEDVIAMMDEIEGKKKELFLETYDVVNNHFKDIFLKLSTKGEASLELENPEEPFEGGLSVKVRLSGNKFMDIRSLSGGEKTMTALAFIFAIQEHDPATFYVLDEVDAALDKKNSEKLAKLVAKYSDRSQYLIISHNDGVISEAENLYGVSMNEHGISQVVSLKI